MNALACLRGAGLTVAACAFAVAYGAQLDVVADAVVGKPNLQTNAAASVSATYLGEPGSIAEDAVTGELWVADGNRVLRFASAGGFANGEAANLVLGQAVFTANAPNRGALPDANTLSGVGQVAVDAFGRLYVADAGNHRVLMYRPPFSSGMGASVVLGQDDFTSVAANRGLATAANSLDDPQGVAVGAPGIVYVADRANNRVLEFEEPITTGKASWRAFGQVNLTSNAAGTSNAALSAPLRLAVDPIGNLWVADSGNNRVLRFDTAGFQETYADRVLCQASYWSALAGTSDSACRQPGAVAVDTQGNVYVAESGNSRILLFASTGSAAVAVIGQATMTDGDCNGLGSPDASHLCRPEAVIVDSAGNLLVADSGNGRVLRYDLPLAHVVPVVGSLSPATVARGSGAFTLTVNGSGFYRGSVVSFAGAPRETSFVSGERLLASIPAGDIVAAGPFAVNVTNASPGGGASASLGLSVYTAAGFDGDADRVLGQPSFTTSASGSQVGGRSLDGQSTAVLNQPMGIAIAPDTGRLFVSDYSANRVLSWPSVLAFNNAQSADVVIGQPDEVSGQWWECKWPPDATSLCRPDGLGTDDAGALYVADTNNDRVLKFVPPFFTGMPASRVFGQYGTFTWDQANNAGVTDRTLFKPSGVLAHGGRLFVHDTGNRRIVMYPHPDTSDAASVAIGQASLYQAANDPASASRFRGAGHLAMDSAGRLYAAFGNNSRVLRFSPPFATNMPADLVLGQRDFDTVGNSPLASATSFSSPYGIAVDASDRIYVADGTHSRVLRFEPPIASGMAASAVVGQTAMSGSFSGVTRSRLDTPYGVAVYNEADLLIADAGNHRVLRFDTPLLTPMRLDVLKEGAGNGSVASYPAGIDCGSACNAAFPAWGRVALIAEPAPGFVFAGWYGAGCSGTGLCTVLLTVPATVTATFNPVAGALTIARGGAGSGVVSSSPAGIDCGATCSVPFDYGTAVTLAATPAAGSVFAGWSGAGCSGTGACSITMNGPATVGATFDVANPPRLANISTRMHVLTGNNVMIGGFVVGGVTPKTVVITAVGPSLAAAGIANPLANPTLSLVRSSDQQVIATNDDWGSAANAAQIQAARLAPANALESAIMVTLAPGAYTAIVQGVGGGTGVAIVAVYEVDHPEVPLTNTSTRGAVLTGNDVMIGGFIIHGSGPQTVVVTATGPSLVGAGIPNALANPTLTLVRSSDHAVIAANDDWQDAPNAAQLQAVGLAPANAAESAIMMTLDPGAYTAIVQGVGGATGVGIVAVYAVQ